MVKRVLLISFLILKVANAFSNEIRIEPQKTSTMYEFADVPLWYRLFETKHVKVLANANQYYLGRLMLITKTDEKDGEELNQSLGGSKQYKLYPSLDYIVNHRRDVYNELLDVLSALNKGRKDWLLSQGLNGSPTLFNELTADNLSYCENRKQLKEKGKGKEECIETFHHAHMHSIPRYKKQILLTYDKNALPQMKLSYYDGQHPVFTEQDGQIKYENSKENPGKVWVLFNDTEYGDIIDFKKKLILVEGDPLAKSQLEKIQAEIQLWVLDSISKASKPYLNHFQQERRQEP